VGKREHDGGKKYVTVIGGQREEKVLLGEECRCSSTHSVHVSVAKSKMCTVIKTVTTSERGREGARA